MVSAWPLLFELTATFQITASTLLASANRAAASCRFRAERRFVLEDGRKIVFEWNECMFTENVLMLGDGTMDYMDQVGGGTRLHALEVMVTSFLHPSSTSLRPRQCCREDR